MTMAASSGRGPPAGRTRASIASPAKTSGSASPSVVTVALTRPLVGHLQGIARQLTGGDFEALVVWCEVAHGSVAHMIPHGADASALVDCLATVTTQPELARPVMLCDLAAATGIPRETVRRKLERLAVQGHLRRRAGGWVIGPERLPPHTLP